MALQFTPNPRATGNLALTANAKARLSSIVSIGWANITGKPDFDALYEHSGEIYEITSGSSAPVAADAKIIRVNKSVGSPTTLNLPTAADKTCSVLICDWKGDAGANNITILPSGTEKIQGLSSWVIAGDTGSIFLRPLPGVGYAI